MSEIEGTPREVRYASSVAECRDLCAAFRVPTTARVYQAAAVPRAEREHALPSCRSRDAQGVISPRLVGM